MSGKKPNSMSINSEKCKICASRNLDCCDLPIFKESEAIKIIEENEKEIRKANVALQRYIVNSSVWTFIPKKYLGREHKYFKLIQSGKEKCPFLINQTCILGENKPFYCKVKRIENSPLPCPFRNINNEELKTKPIEELKKLKEESLNGKKIDFFITNYYAEDIAKKPIKQNKRNKRNLQIKKDELIWTLILHSLLMNGENEKNIFYKAHTEKRILIENKEVIINSLGFVVPKLDNYTLKSFMKKINNIMSQTLHGYDTLKIDTLINKVQGIVNGIDKQELNNEDLKKDYKGFLLALALIRLYQDTFKNKMSIFKGNFSREEINELGDMILDVLYEEGKNEEEIFEKVGEFAEKFIRRVEKATI